MDDLIAFLKARLDQQYEEAYGDREFSNLGGVQDYADFIVRDIEAKRRILDIHASGSDPCDASMRSIPCDTVLLLALPFADHSDYQERWKP